jgi:hypothetical protein
VFDIENSNFQADFDVPYFTPGFLRDATNLRPAAILIEQVRYHAYLTSGLVGHSLNCHLSSSLELNREWMAKEQCKISLENLFPSRENAKRSGRCNFMFVLKDPRHSLRYWSSFPLIDPGSAALTSARRQNWDIYEAISSSQRGEWKVNIAGLLRGSSG